MIFGAAGGEGGLGWFIFKRRVFMDTPGIFAGLIVIIFIGILVEDLVFNKLEEITIRKWGMTYDTPHK
jgi:NitT/TauT family transport system permease protein